MKNLNKIQKLTCELEDIESIEETGYKDCVDIEVQDDNSFTLSNGLIVHNSAQVGLSDGLGRKECGMFSTRGCPLNTYSCKIEKIAANEELNNMIKILNLKLGADKQNMTYDNIVIATDADADGAHLASLYIAFFSKFCPSIIKEGHLRRLRTPIICLLDKKDSFTEMFFTFDEYNEYIRKNSNHGYRILYFKGLGSWKQKQMKELLKIFSLEKLMEPLEYDEEAEKLIDDWCALDKADVRKEYLKANEFSIFSI